MESDLILIVLRTSGLRWNVFHIIMRFFLILSSYVHDSLCPPPSPYLTFDIMGCMYEQINLSAAAYLFANQIYKFSSQSLLQTVDTYSQQFFFFCQSILSRCWANASPKSFQELAAGHASRSSRHCFLGNIEVNLFLQYISDQEALTLFFLKPTKVSDNYPPVRPPSCVRHPVSAVPRATYITRTD